MTPEVWLVIAILLFGGLVVVFFAPPKEEAQKTQPRPKPKPKAKPKEAAEPAPSLEELPSIYADDEEAEDVDPTKVGTRATSEFPAVINKIVRDTDAAEDAPPHAKPLILLSATAQTDQGRRRKANEDSLLVDEPNAVYVVADGMGGYRGGQLASTLAVDTVREAFHAKNFEGRAHKDLPAMASELARAVQMANLAILRRAEEDRRLTGMGTTICAARFSPNKQRLYVGHVGDSRLYRLRDGSFQQLTVDHTMKDYGVQGEQSAHLSRAVGVWPVVPIDILLAKPVVDDVYLLCSDGLTKMIRNDADIAAVLRAQPEPGKAVDELIHRANENGGLDNITVILIRVMPPDA